VRIGEPSRHASARTLVVALSARPGHAAMRLARRMAALPRWTPGSHIDVECGDTGISRQYSLCGDPAIRRIRDRRAARSAKPWRSAWIHGSLRVGDAQGARPAQPLPARRDLPQGDLHRRRHRRHADQRHGAARESAGHRLRDSLLRPLAPRMALLDELAALHGARLQAHVRDEGQRADFAQCSARPTATRRSMHAARRA
jgi:hypothetical protein